MRVSASDYTEGGIDINEMVNIVKEVKEHIDVVKILNNAYNNHMEIKYPKQYVRGYK